MIGRSARFSFPPSHMTHKIWLFPSAKMFRWSSPPWKPPHTKEAWAAQKSNRKMIAQNEQVKASDETPRPMPLSFLPCHVLRICANEKNGITAASRARSISHKPHGRLWSKGRESGSAGLKSRVPRRHFPAWATTPHARFHCANSARPARPRAFSK